MKLVIRSGGLIDLPLNNAPFKGDIGEMKTALRFCIYIYWEIVIKFKKDLNAAEKNMQKIVEIILEGIVN